MLCRLVYVVYIVVAIGGLEELNRLIFLAYKLLRDGNIRVDNTSY